MSGKYNAKFPKLKFMKNQSKSKKQKQHGLSVKIMWVVVKMDNGIIGDFKIGVEMMKWRW